MASLVRISEAASLALHAMAVLAKQQHRRFTSGQLADMLGASTHHLSKVMLRLAKAGLVDATRGPKGGFQLKKTPEQIRLIQIYEAVEGPLDETECLLSQVLCGSGECMIGSWVRELHKQVHANLAGTTLADLAQGFTAIDVPTHD
jgi:Rrf2 family protein